jgi:hypothetical protein
MIGVSYPGFMQFRHAHPDFEEGIAQAVAEGVARGLQIIQNGLDSPDQSIQIRAATWFLEHVHPEHFARNRIEVTGKDGSPLFGDGPLLPIERLRQLIAEDQSALASIEVNPEKLLGNGQSDELTEDAFVGGLHCT